MDLESRRRWEQYTKAKQAMLERPDTPEAPMADRRSGGQEEGPAQLHAPSADPDTLFGRARRAIVTSLALALLGGLAAARPAGANPEILTYRVLHPLYGDIGTFTAAIDQTGSGIKVDNRLRIAVRILGIVVYRMDADGTEILDNDRLLSFQNVIERNGDKTEIDGKADGDRFVVHSPKGTATVPGNIEPSDSWLLQHVGANDVVSTRTGKIRKFEVSGGEAVLLPVNGASIITHHYRIAGAKPREVWLGDDGVPVKFQTYSENTPLTFVLTTPSPAPQAADAKAAPGRTATQRQ